jgi:hypothetical protein
MRIQSSQLSLSSTSTQSSLRTEQTRVRAWTDDSAARVALSPKASEAARAPRPAPQSAQQCDDAKRNASAGKAKDAKGDSEMSQFLNSREGIHLMLLKAILEQTTGRKFNLSAGADYELSAEDQQRIDELSHAAGQAVSATPAQNAAPPRVGWGLEIQSETRQERHELTHVDASGTLLTKDGREIRFNANFSYQRDEVSTTRFELRAGDAKLKDPLVLVFDGTTPELGEALEFDLDGDGQKERVAIATGNAALLVHDKNHDGQVNDGSELLGALSGSGFTELSALDDDGNGFIDEGDAAFANLYTWEGREDGSDRLVSLAERGVGALFTGRVASPFDLRAADGELQGRIRETGLFVSENGQVHALQQVDLKTEALPAPASGSAAQPGAAAKAANG